MVYKLEGISKRYGRNWLFRDVDYCFDRRFTYGIRGPNGSGKSTLMKMLYGFVSPTSGIITLSMKNSIISETDWVSYINFSAPYINPPLEFKLEEFLRFHSRFKSFISGISVSDFMQLCELDDHRYSYLRDFSSGMLQRLKLAMAMMMQSSIILFDEPTSNLDYNYKQWFFTLLDRLNSERLVIIASNESEEWDICDKLFDINDWIK